MILSFDVGEVNLAYCLISVENKKILNWNVVNIKASTYDKQCEKLIEELNKINLENETKTTVVIERQPCRNPKMRIISGQIQMYYALKKYNDENVSKVVYYSPKHKLKCFVPQENDPAIIEKHYKSSYSQRKYLATQYCSIMIRRELEQDQQWIDFFDQNKNKKDDLSDSYLQGIAYLMKL
jgi:hypothetical protein